MIASVHNLEQHNKAKPVRRIWLLLSNSAFSFFIDDFTAFFNEEASICANTFAFLP
jgi:hypothetical protein